MEKDFVYSLRMCQGTFFFILGAFLYVAETMNLL